MEREKKKNTLYAELRESRSFGSVIKHKIQSVAKKGARHHRQSSFRFKQNDTAEIQQ